MAKTVLTGIYKIQSKVHPDRCYIGSASNIKRRWLRHKKDLREQNHNDILQNHYNKYGLGDLEFSIVALCHKDELIPVNKIIWIEQCFILAFHYPERDRPYFNVNGFAGSCAGVKRVFTEEHKQHMSEGRQGIVFTPEHCANISKGRKGVKSSKPAKKRPGYRNEGTWDKGHEPWNKGKKTGQKVWNKGIKRPGFVPKSAFKKGDKPWNDGLKLPYKPRPKQVEALRKRREEKERGENNSK